MSFSTCSERLVSSIAMMSPMPPMWVLLGIRLQFAWGLKVAFVLLPVFALGLGWLFLSNVFYRDIAHSS